MLVRRLKTDEPPCVMQKKEATPRLSNCSRRLAQSNRWLRGESLVAGTRMSPGAGPAQPDDREQHALGHGCHAHSGRSDRRTAALRNPVHKARWSRVGHDVRWLCPARRLVRSGSEFEEPSIRRTCVRRSLERRIQRSTQS